jgi:transcriptional regulator GlxA family with amidase domain
MTRTIAILAMPGVQLLDVSGPLDVFAEANVQAGKDAYRLCVVSGVADVICSSSGVRLLADYVIGDGDRGVSDWGASDWGASDRGASDRGDIDTLLVAGSPKAAEDRPGPILIEWLRSTAPVARRYGSVCSGAFLLGAAGLLDGRRVTTHWAVAERLAQAYPSATVDEDALYVRDGPLRTAAGVTAGLDLALALIEEDLGRDVAMKVAGQLVMFFKRPGGQMQFSRRGEAGPAGRSALQEVQRWIAANPAEDHSVANLAGRLGLSPRHFARLFRDEVGITPAAWIEAVRVTAARRLLEAGQDAPKQVAARCGFADADTLRRAFVRHVGVTPAEYRKRFAGAAE